MSKTLFVVGTGTDVGKTYIAGLIVKKLRESGASCGYYKAAMSGNNRRADGSLIPGDASFVKEMSGIDQPLEEMCPYVYERAVSPHLASRIEGNPVRMKTVLDGFLRVCEKYEYVTLEGSGGILCPLCFDGEEIWLADVIKACHAPCLLVADAGLGTINDVGLSAFYMKQSGIPLRGIIFNHYQPGDVMQEDNLRMCERVAGVRVITCVKDGDACLDIPADVLGALYE